MRIPTYEVWYRHTTRTLGGDVVRSARVGSFFQKWRAEKAEGDAWTHCQWKQLEPGKDGTETWIAQRFVQL